MIRAAGLIWIWMALPAAALELALPGTARLTVERNTAPDRFEAPVGVFAEGQVPRVIIEGDVRRAAWRLDTAGLTPLQIIRPLRDQVEAADYEILLDCGAAECGGYDFRFATEVLPGPNMYVNIRSYHVITAQHRTEQNVITILASAASSSAYVQIIEAGSTDGVVARPRATAPSTPVVRVNPEATGDLSAQLLQQGHVVLGGLDFGSGTSDLGAGPFATLDALAAFLTAEPGIRIALVGHTDSVGSLEANIALSRQRAQSVRRRLIEGYSVAGARMEAQGMGYLAPVATNLSAEGRDANRRVEAILLSAE